MNLLFVLGQRFDLSNLSPNTLSLGAVMLSDSHRKDVINASIVRSLLIRH